jgi:hypothetical protein
MLAINKSVSLVALAVVAALAPAAFGQDGGGKPFQLGAETNAYGNGPAYPEYPAYPAPQMVPQTPRQAPHVPAKPLKANIQQTQRPPMQMGIQQNQQRPPMQAMVQQAAPPPGVLPGQFLGRWQVLGSRSKVEARPEFQGAIDGIFTMSNSQMWDIVGNPGSYSMNSTSGVSSVQVGNCTASTAFIRYQHQIKNTMAREAIVMQISPDGRQFQGMQRISIQKPGEPTPRATVTYQLMGQRQ